MLVPHGFLWGANLGGSSVWCAPWATNDSWGGECRTSNWSEESERGASRSLDEEVRAWGLGAVGSVGSGYNDALVGFRVADLGLEWRQLGWRSHSTTGFGEGLLATASGERG